MIFSERLNILCEDIVTELELPENGVFLYSNLSPRGEKKGEEISKTICINEPEYPPVPSTKGIPNKSAIVMNIPNTGKDEIELIIRNSQYDVIDMPSIAYKKNVKSDTEFIHVIFPCQSNILMEYIKQHILFCVDNYESSNKFGCCSKFMKCSNAKKCVHENSLYAKGCAYGKNIRQGRIFYGNKEA